MAFLDAWQFSLAHHYLVVCSDQEPKSLKYLSFSSIMQTAAEYDRRRENFFKELEIVIADVVWFSSFVINCYKIFRLLLLSLQGQCFLAKTVIWFRSSFKKGCFLLSSWVSLIVGAQNWCSPKAVSLICCRYNWIDVQCFSDLSYWV